MRKLEKKIIKRAIRSIVCSPFSYNFYKETQLIGLNGEAILSKSNHYTKKSFHTLKKLNFYENEFRWLIKVGVLRREVDGQGLTSKVRLTPLGRQIFAIHPTLTAKRPSFKDKFLNWIKRLI